MYPPPPPSPPPPPPPPPHASSAFTVEVTCLDLISFCTSGLLLELQQKNADHSISSSSSGGSAASCCCLVQPSNNQGWPSSITQSRYDQAVENRFPLMRPHRDRLLQEYGVEEMEGQATHIVETGDSDVAFVAYCAAYPCSGPETAGRAMASILAAVQRHNDCRQDGAGVSGYITDLICPGICTYRGNVHSEQAAVEMARAVQQHTARHYTD